MLWSIAVVWLVFWTLADHILYAGRRIQILLFVAEVQRIISSCLRMRKPKSRF